MLQQRPLSHLQDVCVAYIQLNIVASTQAEMADLQVSHLAGCLSQQTLRLSSDVPSVD